MDIKQIAGWLQKENAAILYALNVFVSLAVAWGLHLDSAQIGAVTTIASALITVITTFTVKPFPVATFKGAALVMLTAFGAWHLHWSANTDGLVVAAASIIIGLVLSVLNKTARLAIALKAA